MVGQIYRYLDNFFSKNLYKRTPYQLYKREAELLFKKKKKLFCQPLHSRPENPTISESFTKTNQKWQSLEWKRKYALFCIFEIVQNVVVIKDVQDKTGLYWLGWLYFQAREKKFTCRF